MALGILTSLGNAFIPVESITVAGRMYLVGTTPTGLPVVRCEETQRDWRMQAEELIRLAKAAGIDRAGQE